MGILNRNNLIQTLLGGILGFLLAKILTNTTSIAFAFAALSAFAPNIYYKRKIERKRRELQKLWPEILDHLISGLNSGLSMAQTLSALASRGPIATRDIFAEFANAVRSGQNFSSSIWLLKDYFKDPVADQVCEVLDFARTSGSRDSSLTLRTLATYIRTDLALRNEITAKHGWIKNAAILAGVAPWLLLIILSTQKSTITAYSNPIGISILILGVVLTATAFLWMDRVGRIEAPPRIFDSKSSKIVRSGNL